MTPPSVLGIIPARGGSKGIPGKNIALLAGKPLIEYTIRAARASDLLAGCLVSTDSEEIASVCRALDAEVPALRPAELSSDSARVQDAVRYALEHWIDRDYDYVMLLQPTAPFRLAEDIDAAIRLAAERDAASVVSFTEEDARHPYYMYYLEEERGRPSVRPFADYKVGTPRQEFPRCAYRNGAIYLAKTSVLLEQDTFVTSDVVPLLMPAGRAVNVDAPEDLHYAEYLVSSGAVETP